jgi:hypothetical protein
MELISSTFTTFIKNYIYNIHKEIILKDVNLWSMSYNTIPFSNYIILLELNNGLFLSSNKSSIYLSHEPCYESLWITCYELYNLSQNKELAHITDFRYLTNIYGSFLCSNNINLFISNIYNKNTIKLISIYDIQNFQPYYNSFIKLTKHISLPFYTSTNISLYYITNFNKLFYNKYTLWSLTKNINKNSNLICILQHPTTKYFINSDKKKIFFSKNISTHSIWLITYNILFNNFKLFSNKYGLLLSVNLKNNKLSLTNYTFSRKKKYLFLE